MSDDFSDLADLIDLSESIPEGADPDLGPPPPEEPAFLTFSDGGDDKARGEIGDGTCAECGAPTFRPPGTTATGRKKRTPKYCDLHGKREASNTERPKSQGLETRLKALQVDLSDNMKTAGAICGAVLPVTGYILVEDSDDFTNAIIRLARRHPRALLALEKAAEVGPGVVVGKELLKLGVALQVDGGKLQPDAIPSKYLGVERVYNEVHNGGVQHEFRVPDAPPAYEFGSR